MCILLVHLANFKPEPQCIFVGFQMNSKPQWFQKSTGEQANDTQDNAELNFPKHLGVKML